MSLIVGAATQVVRLIRRRTRPPAKGRRLPLVTPYDLTGLQVRSAFGHDRNRVAAYRADAPPLRDLAQDANRPDLNPTPGTFAVHDASIIFFRVCLADSFSSPRISFILETERPASRASIQRLSTRFVRSGTLKLTFQRSERCACLRFSSIKSLTMFTNSSSVTTRPMLLL